VFPPPPLHPTARTPRDAEAALGTFCVTLQSPTDESPTQCAPLQALASRHMNATKMNAQSSRSHAVFVFGVGSALLFVIDAGGTERVQKSEAEGTQCVPMQRAPAVSEGTQCVPMQRAPAVSAVVFLWLEPAKPPLFSTLIPLLLVVFRLKESMAINQSVSAVRRVFETLRFNQSHPTLQQVVPYRSNKLTLLLKPLFTGKAGKLATFVVLLTAYPGQRDYDEKRGTLKAWGPPWLWQPSSASSLLLLPVSSLASPCIPSSRSHLPAPPPFLMLRPSHPWSSRVIPCPAVRSGHQERGGGVRAPAPTSISCHGAGSPVCPHRDAEAALDGHGEACTVVQAEVAVLRMRFLWLPLAPQPPIPAISSARHDPRLNLAAIA
jgi:hypothetical protein